MKTPRKKLDKKCLDLWSLIVRLPQKCAICGKEQSELNKIIFQGHHIISRRYSAGRWALENGLCICVGCHFLEKPDPEKFRDMILKTIGENRFNELKEKYMKTCKVTTADLELIRAGLKLELEARKLSYLDSLPF
jgi:hypothetical protein